MSEFGEQRMKLYDFWRSSAAYLVRIAVNLKGIDVGHQYVNLSGGDHQADAYGAVNPQRVVPTLVDGNNTVFQSQAIIEYLEETQPRPSLLPEDAVGRARVRALALAVACEIHPLNNLRVRKHLADGMGLDAAAVIAWQHHWFSESFGGIEAMLSESSATGQYCHGDTPSMADAFLIPQVFNARVVDADLSAYPTILRIDEACCNLPAFAYAAPENQPDALKK
jgi:maleylacetoacetate isomerase